MSMTVDHLMEELQKAQTFHRTAERVQADEKKKIAKEEIPYVFKLADKLRPFFNKKIIHGEEAVLIYKFNPNGKTFISPEAYLKQNGDVVYEVYDETNYRRYVPDANILEGYNIMPLEEFLLAVPFYELFDYVVKLKDSYYDTAQKMVENNQKRRRLFEELKSRF